MHKNTLINNIHLNKIFIYASIFFSLSLIYFRSPILINEPRFWAEEGIWYFEKAFNSKNCFSLLTNFGDQAAYYLFLPRFIGSLSCLVDISFAPTVTTYFGILFIIIPIIIILNYNNYHFRSKIIKTLLILVYLFSVTCGEAWLNSTNLGFIVPIIFFLIIMDDIPKSKIKLFLYYSLVFLSLTTGVMSIILSPILFLKYLKEKKIFYRNLLLMVLLAFLLQISYFTISLFLDLLSTGRFSNFNFIKFTINYLSYNYVYSLFGYIASIIMRYTYDIYFIEDLDTNNFILNIISSSDILKKVFDYSLNNNFVVYALIIITIIFFAFLIYKISNSLNKINKFIFLYVCIFFGIIIQFLSLDMHGEYRYSMVINFVFLFFLMQAAFNKNIILFKFFIFISVLIGIMEFRLKTYNYVDNSWPKWSEEITVWNDNNNYNIKIWPYKRGQYLIWKEKKEEFTLSLKKIN